MAFVADIEIGGSILNGYIELCSSNGDLETALGVVVDVLDSKVPLIQSSINSVLRSCVANNDLRNLKRFLKAMRDSEIPEMQPDNGCYTALITLLGRVGRVEQMERAFDEMRQKNLEPTSFTYSAMLSCYVDFNIFNKAQEIWGELARLKEDASVRIPDHAWNSMLYAHVWQGDVVGAVELFRQMKESGDITPNTHSYTALLRLYAQNNDAHNALQLFQEMEDNRVLPQLGTLNALIDCCGRSGDMEAAEEVYKHLLARQFVPSSDTYYLLVKGYCDQRDVENALRVYEEAKSGGIVVPTQSTCVTVLETLLAVNPSQAEDFFSDTIREFPKSSAALYRIMIEHFKATGDAARVRSLTLDQKGGLATKASASTAPPSTASRKPLRVVNVVQDDIVLEEEESTPPQRSQLPHRPQTRPQQAYAPPYRGTARSSPPPASTGAPTLKQPARPPPHVERTAVGSAQPAPASSAQARKKVASIVSSGKSQSNSESPSTNAEDSPARATEAPASEPASAPTQAPQKPRPTQNSAYPRRQFPRNPAPKSASPPSSPAASNGPAAPKI